MTVKMSREGRSASTQIVGVPITLPSFASQGSGCSHFFGTRHSSKEPPSTSRPNGSSEYGLGNGDFEGFLPEERSKGVQPKSVITVKQVHGTDILIVGRGGVSASVNRRGWDALVTDQARVVLTVRTADCVPVLVHDREHGVVAAVHAGWRGAVAGILPKTLSAMKRRFGSNPSRVRIGIGPSVGPCCYEVDAPVLKRLRQEFPEWRSIAESATPLRAFLDLRKLLRRQAELVGANPADIHTVGVCTVCHPHLFYSYRREGTVHETMVNGIMLTNS